MPPPGVFTASFWSRVSSLPYLTTPGLRNSTQLVAAKNAVAEKCCTVRRVPERRGGHEFSPERLHVDGAPARVTAPLALGFCSAREEVPGLECPPALGGQGH